MNTTIPSVRTNIDRELFAESATETTGTQRTPR